MQASSWCFGYKEKERVQPSALMKLTLIRGELQGGSREGSQEINKLSYKQRKQFPPRGHTGAGGSSRLGNWREDFSGEVLFELRW